MHRFHIGKGDNRPIYEHLWHLPLYISELLQIMEDHVHPGEVTLDTTFHGAKGDNWPIYVWTSTVLENYLKSWKFKTPWFEVACNYDERQLYLWLRADNCVLS